MLWRLCERTFAYTNHTVMAEALERWPEDMVKTTLPRIYQILQGLNERLLQAPLERLSRSVGAHRRAWRSCPMVRCIWPTSACAFAYSVNGVSQLHAEILKKSTFRDYYTMEPQKFIGITNGITHRRWLM